MWLPLAHSLLGTWPATQACALAGNRTSDPLAHRPALSPLSHTSHGSIAGFAPLMCTLKMLVGAVKCPVFLSLYPGYSVPVFSWSESYYSHQIQCSLHTVDMGNIFYSSLHEKIPFQLRESQRWEQFPSWEERWTS